jgi:outer membrane protein TolC
MTVSRIMAVLLVFATVGHASAQESPLERYVLLGLGANAGLRQQELVADQAEASFTESRANYLPSLAAEARHSWADGGRTFDVPVGDLMNPAYSALNALTGSQQFPVIDNQSLHLLRDREQDTRLRVTQVLWNPAIRADARSKRYQADAARAGVEAARRALIRDIRIAYYQYANAAKAEVILDAALALVEENERSSTVLWQTDLATRDQVHRARAERLDVETQRARAETDRRLAASYFNYLLGRESSAEIEISADDLDLPDAGCMGRLYRVVASPGDGWSRALLAGGVSERPELEQLDLALAAAGAGLSAARATSRPTVALALDAGIQGRDYGFGEDHRYLMASIVASWKVTSGGGERARTRKAALQVARSESERADAEALLRLELETAARRAHVAVASLDAAAERVEEAEGAFILVRRRREEGLATPLEFYDARASLTRAQQSLSIGEAEALIRLAELEYAMGDCNVVLSPAAPGAGEE